MRCCIAAVLLVSLVAGCEHADSTASANAQPNVTPISSTVGTLVQFKVDGMSCEHHCAKLVADTLREQPGVNGVEVDFPSHTANCRVSEPLFDSAKAVEQLAAAGYTATVVESTN